MKNELKFPVCDYCGEKKAVYHERTVHNNNRAEIFLCEECMGKYENERKSAAVVSIFSAVTDVPVSGINSSERQAITVCPKCAYTSGQYLDTGYLGCPYCYTAFFGMMSVAVARLQRSTHHIGKRPIRGGGNI